MNTAENLVRDKNRDIISVPPNTTIHDALKIMTGNRIGAMLIKNEGRIVGIWTERDLMRNVMVEGFDPKTALIGDYMVTGLQSSPHTDSVYNLMDKFLGLRLRHLLVEKDGAYIGLLSIGDVIKACLLERTSELKELNSMLSWKYYEEWKPPSESGGTI